MPSLKRHFVLRIPYSILLLLFPVWLAAQNLVANPGFETLTHEDEERSVYCRFTRNDREFDERAKGWTTFSGLTPDLLSVDSGCGLLKRAHRGRRCAGIIHYLPAADIDQPADFHEFIEGRLLEPLVPGQRYRVELWIHTDTAVIRAHIAQVYARETPVAPVHAGNLGIWFTPKFEPFRQGFYQTIEQKALKPQVNFAKLLKTNGKWAKVTATFVADQPHRFFVIGNFFTAAATVNDLPAAAHREIDELNDMRHNAYGKTKRAAYLCLDDISVTPDTTPAGTIGSTLLKTKKYTFSAGVLFDTGSAALRPEAGPALRELADFLRQYPAVRLGIVGHTDNVGTEAYNLDLSQRRAGAVARYLTEHGVAASRLEAAGRGEGSPLSTNDTEQGRQQNRRVECRVLE